MERTFASELGSDAVYRPAAGAVVDPLRVIQKRPDTVVDYGDTSVKSATAVFDVLVAHLAKPRKGDRIEIDGEIFEVSAKPRREDDRRLIWTLETNPVFVEEG